MQAVQKRLNIRKNRQFNSCPILWIWFLLLSIFGGAFIIIIFSLPSVGSSATAYQQQQQGENAIFTSPILAKEDDTLLNSIDQNRDDQRIFRSSINEKEEEKSETSVFEEYFREKQRFRTRSLEQKQQVNNQIKKRESSSSTTSDKDVWTTDRFHSNQVVDEVIYSLQSRQDSPSCNARMVKELFASALSMREMCPWCTFAISLVVDDPIYGFLVSEEQHREKTLFLFDRVQRVSLDVDKPRLKRIFASRKASDLMKHAVKPFVVFMDTDVYSSHREFPNAIFNMLHKDKDLIMPVDWAHRHGHLFGRGVPGLCTCLIGFVNTPSVTRIFRLWDEYMTIADPIEFTLEEQEEEDDEETEGGDKSKKQLRKKQQPPQQDESKLYQPKPNESNEERLERWKQILKRTSGTIYQLRDQEVFSLVLHENAFPDVNIFSLSIEWVCPITNHIHSQWSEGIVEPGKQVRYLTQNPCKSVHSHPSPTNAFKQFKYREWMEGLSVITGHHPLLSQEIHKCGGALRLTDLKSTSSST